jgi:hypothetical protein
MRWQGLSGHLTEAAPPSPGQTFQPTTAAVSEVNGAIRAAAVAFVSRIQATADGMATAAGGYTHQEVAAAEKMTAVTQVTVL